MRFPKKSNKNVINQNYCGVQIMIWFYKIPYLHYICLWVVCLYSLWKKSFWLWQVFPYKWHKKCHKWMKSNWNYIFFFYLHKFRLYLDLELRHQRFCLTRICKGPHKGRRMRSLWRLPIKIITINSKKKTQWAKKNSKKINFRRKDNKNNCLKECMNHKQGRRNGFWIG